MTEHAATFPYLSCMLLSPFVGLLILLCLKNEQKFLIRAVSVVASGISLALAIFTFVAYDK
ncbi:MAG: NADH-quinone oxidoreductase subunit M, partial [Deltaproteobacteria bacterium]|nr:NADH-quinone oxidoreductase subunit M [Deltaproteobacteria bacterium]